MFKPGRARRLLFTLTLLVVVGVACLCRLESDDYGVRTLIGPGLSVTYLRDVYYGPVLWFYLNGEFKGRWKAGHWQPAQPTPYPTATPYPTSTPYPTPGRPLPLQGI